MKKISLTLLLLTIVAGQTHPQSYQWANRIGAASTDAGRFIIIDNSGNTFITGSFQGTADFDPGVGTTNLTSIGAEDIFFAKYDSNGNLIWAKNVGSTSTDYGYGIETDNNGNVYITGFFQGTVDFDPGIGTANLTGIGAEDVFFAKYDLNGNFVWAKNVGSSITDYASYIKVDNSGSVFITGSFQNTVDFDPGVGTFNLSSTGGFDIFFAKYDVNGNFVWAKNVGSSLSDYSSSIELENNGSIFLASYFQGTADFDPGAGTANLISAGGYDIAFAKYDINGNYIWAKKIGSTSDDYGCNLVSNNNGNVYIAGYFQGTADFDAGAGTTNLSAAGNYDAFFTKYDTSGNYVWAKSIGSTSADYGYFIKSDNSGNIYLTGAFQNTVDFDPAAGTVNLTSTGLDDIFFAKYDASGNYIWAKNIGGTSSDVGSIIAVDSIGNTYITGYFEGSADFDPNSGTFNLTSAGGSDIFFMKSGGATYTVTTTADAGAGSLRQAIIDANSNAGQDSIIFNLGAGGPYTITLSTALPDLTDNAGVTIDGFSNTGASANTIPVFNTTTSTPLNPVYKIILGNSGTVATGLRLTSDNNIIKGLVLQNFGDGTPSANDIAITITGNNNSVLGCYIGLEETGTTRGTNTVIGIQISGANNAIGNGTTLGANLISGMNFAGNGINITGAIASGNTIKGNIIGLQKDGSTIVAAPFAGFGIYVTSSSSGNTIGGSGAGEGNVVSGHYNGIELDSSSGNTILGNIIGTQANGMAYITSNVQNVGISINESPNNTIGGNTAGTKNVISANESVGIQIFGASSTGNIVKGNYIGIDKNGTAFIASSSQSTGVQIQNSAASNTIGGSGAGEGNVISGNSQYGIVFISTAVAGNSVLGNIIGPQADGITYVTSNPQSNGVYVSNSPNNIIGGNTAGARNIISANETYGVVISGASSSGNVVKGNYIGIDKNGTTFISGSNQNYGVYIEFAANSNTIGGSSTGEGNVISGNVYGIYSNSSAAGGNTVFGNIIGPQADGISYVGSNVQDIGIRFNNSPNNTIGGNTGGARNIISANGAYGVVIEGSSTGIIMKGNYIGLDITGTTFITGSIQYCGILIKDSAANNIIGGSGAGEENHIAFNTNCGVSLTDSLTKGNLISRNPIYNNTGKPINLNYGVNQANNGKAAPVITTATTTTVSGTSGGNDVVEIFKNVSANCFDASVYVGTDTADGSGNWSLAVSLSNGDYVLASATDTVNNTSEFSVCKIVPYPPHLITVISTPDTCGGSCNGTLSASSSGGLSPYTYSWSGGLGTGANKTAVCSGTYTVTVNDQNGFFGTKEIILSPFNITTPALAGFDRTACGTSTTLSGNTPTIGTGNWSLISGAGTIVTPSSPASQVTGLTPGTNTTLRWTITNAGCPSVYDDVTIFKSGTNDGALDPCFNEGDIGDGRFYGGELQPIVLQPDGKIIVGGSFTSYRGIPRTRIVRLNTDGNLDASFDPGTGADNTIESIAIQSDGKILIAGRFVSYNGTGRNRIARLNPDGTLDTSFDPGTGADNDVYSIAIQSDGKIILGGSFTTYNGIGRNRIARLNADGTIDISFDPGTGADIGVKAVAIQSDGKILIAGWFNTYNSSGRNHIARLNTDGSIDTSFDPGTGADAIIISIAIQGDGKIIIGGYFTSYNGTGRNYIARINGDGTIDTSFEPGTGTSYFINSIGIQSNGKILIVGSFVSYNGTTRYNAARVNADGTLDTSFDVGPGIAAIYNSVTIQNDGKILIGSIDIICVNANGTPDTSFAPSTGANGDVWSTAIQSDGKIMFGGDFLSYNSTVRNRIARLNANGTLDTSFNPGTGVDGTVYSIAIQSDGKILIGGFFTTYNGTGRNNIARMNSDGTLDTSFDPGTGTDNYIHSVTIQSDGKILIGGNFTSYNGVGRNRIARLNSDGTLDTSFDPGTGVVGSFVYSIAIQSDGKILIGGDFTDYNGTGRNGIARLNTDGTLDTSFDPGTGTGVGNYLESVAIQGNGKIMIGGFFFNYNGTGRVRIARLNADGTLDTSFDPGTGANDEFESRSISIQNDGKIIIGGKLLYIFMFFRGRFLTPLRSVRNDSVGCWERWRACPLGADTPAIHTPYESPVIPNEVRNLYKNV